MMLGSWRMVYNMSLASDACVHTPSRPACTTMTAPAPALHLRLRRRAHRCSNTTNLIAPRLLFRALPFPPRIRLAMLHSHQSLSDALVRPPPLLRPRRRSGNPDHCMIRSPRPAYPFHLRIRHLRLTIPPLTVYKSVPRQRRLYPYGLFDLRAR